MKLKNLKMKNFAKFTNFEVEFDGKITNLVGINGSGKTTIGLTAIWACLKGISKKSRDGQLIGERWRFIGKDKATANIELTLIDEEKNAEIKVINNISADSNKITFHAPKNYKMDRDWLSNLFSVAFLSAKNFTQHSSKEQAILLGIDTASFDDELKQVKEEYTYINRQIKSFGEIDHVEKVEKVSISELLELKNKSDAFNLEQENIAEKIDEYECCVRNRQSDIEDLLNEIENNKAEIKSFQDKLKNIGISLPKVDTTAIIYKINNAEETNQKAAEHDKYIAKTNEKNAKIEELNQNKETQQEIMQKRLDYIKSFNFGFKELSIGEDGGLLLKNKPIKEPYFSKGELEIIVAKLHTQRDPNLKFRFIDDFELLDEQNQESIIKTLLDSGFQIITAQVGDKAESNKNTVLLRECKKIEGN